MDTDSMQSRGSHEKDLSLFRSGKVKILKEDDSLDIILKDDILVTVMTSPDMVPAMTRAAAIVTDEGGMTCHAAIVTTMEKGDKRRSLKFLIDNLCLNYRHGPCWLDVPLAVQAEEV